jgi:hypothetical protein
MDPHAAGMVLNGAPSQEARALSLVRARRVRVDGRGPAELLRFAARLGELLWFYGLDDRPDGDWSAFFLADPATLAASIRRTVPRDGEAALAGLAERLREGAGVEEKRGLLRKLFAAPLALARQVDAWLRVLAELSAWPAARQLHARLAEAVRLHLGPGLRLLRAWDAGAGARQALGRPVGLDYGALLPLWEVEGAARPDPSPFRGPTPEARMDHAAPRLVELFAGFADALAGVPRAAAQLATDGRGEQGPQLALYAAFVSLFRTAQRTMNTMAPRYARFYYHRVLREGPRGPVPDRVYLAFSLAPEAVARAVVPRGTRFSAGQDAVGEDVAYAADRGVQVTAATLARIHMLRAVPGPLVAAFTPAGSPPADAADATRPVMQVPAQQLLASTVPAAAAGGVGGAAAWPTFGGAEPGTVGAQDTTAATLGFAIASPELLLTGGERWLAVTVRYAADAALEGRLASVAALTGASAAEVLGQVVEGALAVELSTAAGWFAPEGWRAMAAPDAGGGSFTLGVQLPPGAPAVVPLYAGALVPAEPGPGEPRPDPAPGLPTLAARLRPDPVAVRGPRGTASVHPLPLLETLRMRAVDLRCRVRGVGDLAVANTDGPVAPGGSFSVFGAVPAVGSFLELRSAELFGKVPSELAVTVRWLALPPHDTGFQGWYRDYVIGLDGTVTPGLFDNRVFRGNVRVVNPGDWLVRASGSSDAAPSAPVYLFRTRRDCVAPVPDPAAPLCPEARYADLPVDRDAVPAGYDPAASALRLELSDPPYAFGATLYTPNVLHAVVRGLPDTEGCQARCLAGCAPLSHAAAGLKTALESCAGSPAGTVRMECLTAVRDRLRAEEASGGASPPASGDADERMTEGVARIDACIAAAKDGMADGAQVEACRAWLADAYAASLAACVQGCLRPGEIRSPSEPWLPWAECVSVDYVSARRVMPGTAAGDGALFHLHPFGGWGPMVSVDDGAPPLLPSAGAPATLMLGFDGLDGDETLTLLFQLAAPGNAVEPATPPDVGWSRLEGDRWEPLPAEAVTADGTHGLRDSGIVALRLPPFRAATGTRIPGGGRWLRCEAGGGPAGFPWTVAILPHATTATRVEGGGPQPAAPLPAGTIKAPAEEVAGLGPVLQPMPSFGGRPAETERAYQLRLAERLRHKDRAAQGWDYERLVLDRFPQLWKVRALPARRAGGAAAGSVLVVVVAGPDGNESADLTVPRAGSALLGAVEGFLAERASPFADIQVVNPVYVRVRVRAEVAFRTPGAGGDGGGSVDRLNADLVAWLSPWSPDAEWAADQGCALETDVSRFIRSRPYVEALLGLEISHDPAPETLEWYFLTSATRHELREAL